MQLWNWRQSFGQEHYPLICSQTPFFVHLLNEDSSLKQTVCFVPGEIKLLPLHYLFQPTWYEHPVNKYTFYGPLSVRINRFDCTSKQGRGTIKLWSIESKKSFHAFLYIPAVQIAEFHFSWFHLHPWPGYNMNYYIHSKYFSVSDWLKSQAY